MVPRAEKGAGHRAGSSHPGTSGGESRSLRLNSTAVTLSVRGLSPGLLGELEYLLAGFPPAPCDRAPDIQIRRRDGGEFHLVRRARVRARSAEPRHLLPPAESLVHASILDRGTGYLMFHGAAVVRAGKAVWLSGPSGSGKSSLCAALLHRPGFAFLADDTVLWDPAGQTLRPYPRPIRLKLDGEGPFPEWRDRGLRFPADYLDTPLWYVNPFRESGAPPAPGAAGGIILDCRFQPDRPTGLEGQNRAAGVCALLENTHPTPDFTPAEIFAGTTDLASRFTFYRLTFRDCHRAAALIGPLLEADD